MLVPKDKRSFVLLFSSDLVYDRSEFAAAGRLLVGTAEFELLDIEHIAGRTAEPVWVEGGKRDDQVFGSAGDDLLVGYGTRLGPDPRDGQADTDNATGVLIFDDGCDLVVGRGGNDLLAGNRGRDSLFGDFRPGEAEPSEAGNDTLFGFGDDDTLSGGGGDDELHGGRGCDLIQGGGGFDLAAWDDLNTGDTPSGMPGIVLNLARCAVEYRSDGLTRSEVLQSPAPGTGEAPVLLGQVPGRPAGPVSMIVAAGTAAIATGLDAADVDTLEGIERFVGGAGHRDIAVLDAGFLPGATGDDGFTSYSDGLSAVWLSGFETVLFA